MTPSTTTHGITTTNNDVKLTVLAGGLTIGEAAVTTDDMTLGLGNLTLNITGNVTQTAGNVITASGLQLLGRGGVQLDEIGDKDTTLMANYSGAVSYTDANSLVIGSVTDTAMSPNTTTHCITTKNNDVNRTVHSCPTRSSADLVTTDDMTLGLGNLTLNITGNVTQTAGNVITASGLQLLG